MDLARVAGPGRNNTFIADSICICPWVKRDTQRDVNMPQDKLAPIFPLGKRMPVKVTPGRRVYETHVDGGWRSPGLVDTWFN